MEKRGTWGTEAPKEKKPFRGFQKITEGMDDASRRGAEIWNEMVTDLIELGRMKGPKEK